MLHTSSGGKWRNILAMRRADIAVRRSSAITYISNEGSFIVQ